MNYIIKWILTIFLSCEKDYGFNDMGEGVFYELYFLYILHIVDPGTVMYCDLSFVYII